MKNCLYKYLILSMIFLQNSYSMSLKLQVAKASSSTNKEIEAPFVSRDIVETFLAVAKALEAGDTIKVTKLYQMQ